jgi:hypothetical protein
MATPSSKAEQEATQTKRTHDTKGAECKCNYRYSEFISEYIEDIPFKIMTKMLEIFTSFQGLKLTNKK